MNATRSAPPPCDLGELRVPGALRPRAGEIIAITDAVCDAHLDREYGQLARLLVARLARKRPSPLTRGDVRIWAAGAVYAVGHVNFLFDSSQRPHLTADQLAARLGVVRARWPTRPHLSAGSSTSASTSPS